MNLPAPNVILNRNQRRLFLVAYLTYATYYLGRVNLSAALPVMEESLNLSKDKLGLLGTTFFVAYAVGTLVNGRLGDMVSPRWLVFGGLSLSALLNLVFGFASSFALLLLLWGLNGLFQATGWGPILRVIANGLNTGQRQRYGGLFASSFVVGNTLAWLLTGRLVSQFGWRAAFWLPALLMILMAVLWLTLINDTPSLSTPNPPPTHKTSQMITDLWQGIAESWQRYWPLNMASACLGFCLVALFIWAPTYFVEVGGLAIGPAANLAALLPVAGIVGTIATGWLVGRFLKQRELTVLAIMMLLTAVLFILQRNLSEQIIWLVTIFMIIGAVIYGAASVSLSMVPLTLGGEKSASTMAGLLDFSSSLGGGLSGWLIGYILVNDSWATVFLMLAVMACVGAIFVFLQTRISAGPKVNFNV